MKLKVYVIDFEVPRRVKKWAIRVGIPIAVILVGGVALAGGIVTFAPSATLTADQLNSSFSYLQSEMFPTQATLPATPVPGRFVAMVGTTQYSVGMTKYCGPSNSSSYNGDLGGYAGAKSICEQSTQGTCGQSKSAHMCSAEELIRSEQFGETLPTGWYSAGTLGEYSPNGSSWYVMQDCVGWTYSTSANYGPGWTTTTSSPDFFPCSTSQQVLCCD